MSKTSDDKAIESLAPVLQKTAQVISPPHNFRDKLYTSRTLIFPSGDTLPVTRGRATAVDDQQFQYLSTHPDFERLTE